MNTFVNIAIEALHIHPRNQEFFDDISGEDYEQFKNSIQEEGILHELIVAPDMTIISGHQRYKAALDLGMQTVPIKIREDLLDEDAKLRMLLAANFGRQKNSEAKKRKVAEEYVRLRGYGQGGDRKSTRQVGALKLSDIAAELGTSERDLQRLLRIERNLTESVKELLDTGVLSKTLAADTIAALSEEEQEELISSLDTTKRITQKQVTKYIEENAVLKRKLIAAEAAPVRVVDNTDYQLVENLQKRINNSQKDYERLHKEFTSKLTEIQNLQEQLSEFQNQSPEQQYHQKIVDSALMFNARVGSFIEEVGGYVWLADKIHELPAAEQKGYLLAIQRIREWVDAIEYNINK